MGKRNAFISRLLLSLFIFTLLGPARVPQATLEFQSIPMAGITEQEKVLLPDPDLILALGPEASIHRVLEALPQHLVKATYPGVHSIAVDEEDLEEIQMLLEEADLLDLVDEIYEDQISYLHRVPSDPLYTYQWNMRAVQMEPAWENNLSQHEVIVAVVDTGVTPYYDLSNVVRGADLSSGITRADTYPGQYSYDGGNHGTAGAAMIAAAHNHLGIAGVQPHVGIMGVKVFTDGMGTTSSARIAEGIIWAADNGADIINLSVGSDFGTPALQQAVHYAHSKGILLVGSSGNDGYHNKISYPAAYPEVMAVGSTDQWNNVSTFSNEGQELELVAPGDRVPLPNVQDGAYYLFSGTSFSAPMVAGAAALLRSLFPDASATDLRVALNSSARDFGTPGWDSAYGHGLLDVRTAIEHMGYADYIDDSNDIHSAERIYPNETLARHLYPAGDMDYYELILKETYLLTIRATSSHENDLVLRFMDHYGNHLFQADNGHFGDEEMLTLLLEPGRYFISVHDYYSRSSLNGYNITVELMDMTPPHIQVLEHGYHSIANEGLAMGPSTISVTDTSRFTYKVLKDGVDIGPVEEVVEEGNYEVIAVDAGGFGSYFGFVLDHDGLLTVTFETGHNEYLESQSILYGHSIGALPHPSKEGMVFKGWYKDRVRMLPWRSDDIVLRNMTLYGDWAAKVLDSIEVTRLPEKTTYLQGEALDLSGLEVVGYFNDGTFAVLDVTGEDVSGFDSETVTDHQVLTVTKEGLQTTFTVAVRERLLEELSIKRLPDKLVYVEGEALDLSGLVVEGHYEGDQVKVEALEDLGVSGFDSSTPRMGQVVTIAKGAHTDFFLVDVVERVLTGIEILEHPKKLVYLEGAAFDPTGLLVGGRYNDGTLEVISTEQLVITGFDSSAPVAAQVVRVEYGAWSASFTVVIEARPVVVEVERVAGTSRYRTAIEISKLQFEKADTVVLVLGTDFPDALAAGPLASAHGAPILLVMQSRIHGFTLEEMKRLGVENVLLLGGEAAIGSAVEEELRREGFDNIQRLSGSNRYGTAVRAAEEVWRKAGPTERVILTSGQEFADALSVGSHAAKEGLPILLTAASRLSPATEAALTAQGIKEVVIIGGEAAVGKAVVDKLTTMGISVERIAGSNRYNTAVEIAGAHFPEATTAIISSGENYVDALAAAPYAAALGAPILLVRRNLVTQGVRTYLERASIHRFLLVGGTAAIDESIRTALEEMER